MRRNGFALLCASILAAVVVTGAGAHSTPQIRAEKAHQRQVMAQVNQIGNQLTVVEGQAQNAQHQLALVEQTLRRNTYKLHVARRNFRAAQKRLMARIYSDYVYGKPTSLDVLAGAKSISGLVNRAESAQVVSKQDSLLGRQALRFEHAVQHRQHELTTLRQKRADAVQQLTARKREVAAELGREKRLLASIGTTIHRLQVQEAQREARLRAEALARLRQIAAEKAAAAAAAAAAANSQSSGSGSGSGSGSSGSGLIGSPVGSPIPTPGSGAGHPEAATIALRYLGVPYVWGGASPSGFDCSGLVMYVYAQLGISLPHYTVSQWNDTEPISTSQMQPGDLVFFDGLGHVGIYIGGGQFVDAPHTGSVVRIDSLAAWGGSFVGARRVP
jgi:cell wall-associated NlpC family hydrolase